MLASVRLTHWSVLLLFLIVLSLAAAVPGAHARPPEGPSADALPATVKWAHTTFSVSPEYNQVVTMPAVGDINLDGIPDIVFPSYSHQSYEQAGILRALSGDDGHELFSVGAPNWVKPISSPVIVDLDNDGAPEVIAEKIGGGLYAFTGAGVLKYESPAFANPQHGSMPAATDLNQDGVPEIVVGRYVLSNNLATVTDLGSGAGGSDQPLLGSVVADVDLDGKPEVIAGNTLYAAAGGIEAQNGGVPALSSVGVGNCDADPLAEIAVVDPFNGGRVYLLDHQMNLVWGPVAVPGSAGDWANGGPPTIADVDGDGKAEIGVGGSRNYVVYDQDGTVLWQQPTHDSSSGFTVASAFDLNEDGYLDLIYGDEVALYVFSGPDGAVLLQQTQASITGFELPVVVDVDADGHAEIVVAANNAFCPGYLGCDTSRTGIIVWEAQADNWPTARPLWHQHAYDAASIRNDLTVVSHPAPAWRSFNLLRGQTTYYKEHIYLPYASRLHH